MNMSMKSVKWSGVLLIIGGILIAVPMLFHPDETQPGFAFQGAWVPVHALMGIGSIAVLTGLTGLYIGLRNRVSVFGNAAFGVAMLGTVLLSGLMFFVEATLLPILGNDPAYSALLSGTGPLLGGTFGIAILASMAIMSLGYVLLAIYLATTGTISVANAVLFIGAPLVAFAPPLPYAIGILGGVLFGSAIAWLGVSVRSGVAHRTLEAEMKIQDECLAHAGGHA